MFSEDTVVAMVQHVCSATFPHKNRLLTDDRSNYEYLRAFLTLSIQMYKFRDSFYKELKDYAQANLGGLGIVKSVPDRNRYFTTLIKKLETWDKNKKGVKNINDLREEHNRIYGERVKEAKDHFDKRESYQEIVKYMSEVRLVIDY